MSTYKAKAIVIKTYRLGEADKIVKLLLKVNFFPKYYEIRCY